MEKFSKWRDPSTGIQPFLPLQPPTGSPVLLALFPITLAFGLLRALLLVILLTLHFLLPFSFLASLIARLALYVLGYYTLSQEAASAKRGTRGVAQSLPSRPRAGDLIIANWTSYLDILILTALHAPTYLLPLFDEPVRVDSAFGRASGTGSASILLPTASSKCVGYVVASPLALMQRTGSLPPTVPELHGGEKVYRSVDAAQRALGSKGPICVLPEGTTSNGRAVLKFGDGVLAEEVGKEGIVWVKFVRHAPPTSLLAPATCPLPTPLAHLRSLLLSLPIPRSASVRTLHPSAAPSSPSFLLSDVLASQPGGAGNVSGASAWSTALALVLAETGRVRRVPGMGWAEKASFLAYYDKTKK